MIGFVYQVLSTISLSFFQPSCEVSILVTHFQIEEIQNSDKLIHP